MTSENHILEILVALNSADVSYIVGGGVAAVLHGVERATMDLDLSVRMSPDNLSKFLSVMSRLKLVPRIPIAPEVLLDPENIKKMVSEKGALVFTFLSRENPFQQVDLFLDSHFDYDLLYKESVELLVGRLEIRVLSIPQLIKLKKRVSPPRNKDLFDISALEDLLKVKK